MLKRQRGVAVITALLLTTLAVTIVASLFWQQQVQVRSMENQRLHLQTKWILRGALDWASLVLQQDARDHGNVTALDHVWNTPLAETRLDQYIERERVEGEVFDATLSGRIIDASSRYNLTNLAKQRVPDPVQVGIYKRLLQNLRLDPNLAERTAAAIANTQSVATTAGGTTQDTPGQAPPNGLPIEFTRLDDLLSVPGYTVDMVAKLHDFAIVLPEPSKVNVNTAPAEVLAALVPDYSVAEAASLVVRRKQAHYRGIDQFASELGGKTLAPDSADVKSDQFLVQSRIRLDRAALDAEALIKRQSGTGATTLVWIRQN